MAGILRVLLGFAYPASMLQQRTSDEDWLIVMREVSDTASLQRLRGMAEGRDATRCTPASP